MEHWKVGAHLELPHLDDVASQLQNAKGEREEGMYGQQWNIKQLTCAIVRFSKVLNAVEQRG